MSDAQPTKLSSSSGENEPSIHPVWSDNEDEPLEGHIFQSESSGSATMPMFVSSLGRGSRKRPDPSDIRLPRAYFEDLKHKKLLETPQTLSQSTGRGKALRYLVNQHHPATIPTHEKARLASQVPPPPALDKNFLGATTRGLTSEVMAGKACLMEKFLGKGAMPDDDGQQGFNPIGTGHRHHSSKSLRSVPNFNLNSRDQWPEMDGTTCQSDKGDGRCHLLEGSARPPTKSYSFQEIMKIISSSGSNWDKSSSQGSSRKGGGEVAGSNRKTRRMKRSERVTSEEGSCDEAGIPPEAGGLEAIGVLRKGTVDDSAATGTSTNQQGAVPSGGNLIQVECLPADITEEHLTAAMNSFGPVVQCNILRDNDSQKCIGIAFIRFENSKACLSAISSLHEEESPFHGHTEETIPKLLVRMVTM